MGHAQSKGARKNQDYQLGDGASKRNMVVRLRGRKTDRYYPRLLKTITYDEEKGDLVAELIGSITRHC